MDRFQAQLFDTWNFGTESQDSDPQYLMSFPDLPRLYVSIPNANQIEEPCDLALSPKSEAPLLLGLNQSDDDDDSPLTSLDPEDMALDDEDWFKPEVKSHSSSDPEDMALSDETSYQPEKITTRSNTAMPGVEVKKTTAERTRDSCGREAENLNKEKKMKALALRPNPKTKGPHHISTVSTNHGTVSKSELTGEEQSTRKRKHVESSSDSDLDSEPLSDISGEDDDHDEYKETENDRGKTATISKKIKKKSSRCLPKTTIQSPRSLTKHRRAVRLARLAQANKVAQEAVQAQSRLVLLLAHYEHLTVAQITHLFPSFFHSLQPMNRRNYQTINGILTTFANRKHGSTTSQARLAHFYRDSEAAKFASETLLQELKAEVDDERQLWRYGEACELGIVDPARPWRLFGMSMEEGKEARRWLRMLGDLRIGLLRF